MMRKRGTQTRNRRRVQQLYALSLFLSQHQRPSAHTHNTFSPPTTTTHSLQHISPPPSFAASNNDKNTKLAAPPPILQAALQDFLQHVEDYLLHQYQTVLVGDYWTAADAVTALAVAAATSTTGSSKTALPQQVHRWCHATLFRLSACLEAATKTTTNKDDKSRLLQRLARQVQDYANQLQLGTTSPLELPQATTATTTTTTTTTTTSPVKEKAVKEKQAKPASPAKESTQPAAPAKESTKPTTTASSSTGDNNAVLQALDKFGIHYQVYNHVACQTADELVANVPLSNQKHTHTKNLFLRDKKHGLFLVTVRPGAAVNTKELGRQLQLPGKTNLRLADASVLQDLLHVAPGCVGPLAVLPDDIAVRTMHNDDDDDKDDKRKITVVLDQALLTDYDGIHSHPLRNDQSVQLTPASLLREVLEKRGVQPVCLEFANVKATNALHTGKAPATRPRGGTTQTPPPPPPTKATAVDRRKTTAKKGETLLALQWKKSEHFANWYTDVIVLSEMISYYDISGCYILRPWSYKMWELVQVWFNARLEEMGVENAYFPLFVSQERLEQEKDHVEGFAPEVAWVTKSGDGELAKPIAVRPTSETIMYPAYADWIQSHRDLPLKLNQWSNVVRWEFKYPTPFLRTREFLWQEGHTAHATFEDAEETVLQALELYRGVYEDLLAVPVIKGYKTEKEKFAGGFRTTTVEAYIAGSGRAIQGATSHHLGQNFGKMFDITFQDTAGASQTAWQTSWGLTTRTIGVMVMVHGDDTGLVLPPAVAPLQVVIVPILSKKLTREQAADYGAAILRDLQDTAGVRCKYDDRVMYTGGWKFHHWEQKGVPIRIEIGPRDIENRSARVVIRHSGLKEDYPVDGLGALVGHKLLPEIQSAMFAKAKKARDDHLVRVTEWKDFVPNLEKNNLVLTPWCGGEHQEWEEWVKTKSREESLQARGEEEEDDKTATSVAAKTLCIPFDQPELPVGTKCVASGLDATCWVLWGRSY